MILLHVQKQKKENQLILEFVGFLSWKGNGDYLYGKGAKEVI
ncbi:hypothetical protein [Halobacillus alkaliphilus]|nr:hypothetical protein [Halobacillus alkaliphilus]